MIPVYKINFAPFCGYILPDVFALNHADSKTRCRAALPAEEGQSISRRMAQILWLTLWSSVLLNNGIGVSTIGIFCLR